MCFSIILFSYGIYLQLVMGFFSGQPAVDQLSRCLQWIREMAAGILSIL